MARVKTRTFLRPFSQPGPQPGTTVQYYAGRSYALDAETEAAATGRLEPLQLFNGADPAAFDHDNDGAPGGSPKGRRRKARG